MSGSTIYWITRLDSLVLLTECIAVAFSIVSILSLIVGGVAFGVGKDFGEPTAVAGGKKSLRYGRNLAIAAIAATTVRVFLPTSKEAAAIIIIPAVVNNETVQAEAREIYDLAKTWLRELAPTQEPKP